MRAVKTATLAKISDGSNREHPTSAIGESAHRTTTRDNAHIGLAALVSSADSATGNAEFCEFIRIGEVSKVLCFHFEQDCILLLSSVRRSGAFFSNAKRVGANFARVNRHAPATLQVFKLFKGVDEDFTMLTECSTTTFSDARFYILILRCFHIEH